MRVAIFDGILETHVGDSLERAFLLRGHQTFNTGKIGSGFKFPSRTSDTSHLDYAVAQILEFKPDLVFVMRPASLPLTLLKKIRSTGATLMAWFSDDPVLFDLSYGPIVDFYDHILHCGNATVLDFYEDWFGRPTGVNIPFWTDHEAFPTVWGSQKPDTRYLFLGNVQDEVRRKRYFELADLTGGVKVYGNIGSDYFGISGGYLDSDAEVVAAASRAEIALNIPQFFKNHRGLDTWFHNLDKLGFFEYPSRVIQYMAMGLPTISIIPEKNTFASYPEMLVAGSISEAGLIASDLATENQLGALSKSVVNRFDRHFSALSRVLAIESLLQDDSWRKLDSHERETWFTQFDATQVSNFPDNIDKDFEIDDSSQDYLFPPEKESLQEYVIFGRGKSDPSSRFRCISETLKKEGFNVTEIDTEDDAHKSLIVKDPSGICDSAINVSKVVEYLGSDKLNAIFVVCGIQAALTIDGSKRFARAGYRTVMIDDSGSAARKQISRLQTRYDIYATSSRQVYDFFQHRGFDQVIFLPYFINPLFYAALQENTSTPKNAVRIFKSVQTEESLSPAIAQDLRPQSVENEYTYEALRSMNFSELASSISAEIAIISHEGTRANPKLNELIPYAVLSANWIFFSRNAIHELIFPYNIATIMVGEVGELKIKASALSRSTALQEVAINSKNKFLELMDQAPITLLNAIASLSEQHSIIDGRVALDKGAKYLFPVVENESTNLANHNSGLLSIKAVTWIGEISDWWVRVKRNSSAVFSQRLEDNFNILVVASDNLGEIMVECEYIGPKVTISQKDAIVLEVEIKREKVVINGTTQRELASKVL